MAILYKQLEFETLECLWGMSDWKVTDISIETIYNVAIEKGALGGKLLGAGGGGFLLFYVPYFKQKYFINHFKKMTTIPFNFTKEKSDIIFKSFTK